MTSIEELLARDIAAVTGGVIVTDSDVRNAREEVEDRIVIDRQRTWRRSRVAIAAAAVAIPVVGVAALQLFDQAETKSVPPADPAPKSLFADPEAFLSGSTPTPERIEGVWRVDNGTTLLKFTSDGAVQFDDAGRLYSDPYAMGSYEINGDLITVTVTGGPGGCAGQTFAMRASLPRPGEMRFVHTQPGSGTCMPEFVPVDAARGTSEDTWWALEHVLPTNNAYLAGIDNSGSTGWKPLEANKRDLLGDWLAEGGGYVLELAPGGAYYVANESAEVVDQGDWSLRGEELTFTSAGIVAGECGPGDRLVLGDVEQDDPDPIVIRGTLLENTCDAVWTPQTWIQIPQ